MGPLALLDVGFRVLNWLSERGKAKQDAQIQKRRIEADENMEGMRTRRDILQADAALHGKRMESKLFWIPWSIAAVPTACWYGWGVLDSLIDNGQTLPDVAALPPQLKAYADIVWSNIFYTGGAVAGVNVLSGTARYVADRLARKR